MRRRKLKVKEQITISDLLKRFPNGFAVSPELAIYEIAGTAKDIEGLPINDKLRGYLAVKLPEVQPGDETFGENMPSENVVLQGDVSTMTLMEAEYAKQQKELFEGAD